MVATLHLPQVAPMAHGHHAVDAEELHLLCQELLLSTLLLGCLGCPLDQGCPLQISDLGGRGYQVWLGHERPNTRNAPRWTKGS